MNAMWTERWLVINLPEKGYGSVLRGGISAAEYKYIVMVDADDSYDFSIY